MTQHYSIFGQAQADVCTTLNEDDVLSGKVLFIPENSKDIDYEIKNAIGSQGIVGIVMTPEATYQGVTSVGEQVWDLRDFTVQIVENPIVNRGQPKYANITALDAATRVAQVLADPRFGLFGQYCPTTIEQGEDSGLIVSQVRFNVQIKAQGPEDDTKTVVTYKDGSVQKLELSGELVRHQIPNWSNAVSVQIGTAITSIADTALFQGDNVETIVVPDTVTSIGENAFAYCSKLTSVTLGQNVTSLGNRFIEYTNLTSLSIPRSVTTIDYYAFTTGDSTFRDVTFEGRTIAEVQAMSNYSWRLWRPQVIHCTDGDITF